jgi:cephalosporin-C deacetylase-like acetyl esterase
MRATSVFLLAALSFAQSQDPYQRMLESKKEVTAQLVKMARDLTAQASAEIASREAWEKVREQRLEEMRDMLGLLPWPKRGPLNVKITGVLDKGSYTIEKIAFESLPKIYVTGNLYVPKNRAGKLPAIIYVCGHSISPYGDKVQYQRHGISFARNGYVAFILDSIQIAETFALHHGVQSQEMYDWYSRGYTPAGVEVWNAMRALDYLETRPEVDKDKFGITGRSGGAAMSWFTAAVDPRIKVSVPVMGISTYAANVELNTQRLHCDCMFPINSWRHDMMHQGALIAPRPLLMAHGRKDSLFPVPGYEEFQAKVGTLYRAYGVGDSFANVVVETGHADSDFLREQAIRWFDTHLMKIPGRKLDMDYSNAEPASLAVFGGNPPADAQNYRVHETFTTAPPPARYKTAAEWNRRRAELIGALRARVFGGLDTARGFPVRTGMLRKPPKFEGKLPAVLYIASNGEDSRYIAQLLGTQQSRNNSIRLVVWPRGIGEVPWDLTFWKDTLRNAMHVGHTVDSLRLADVLEAMKQLRAESGVDPARITVLGRGVSGALGLYAALLDDTIAQVMLIDPPTSHAEGPVFLNILRHTDLPEAAALLAPRRLNFYGRVPKEFEYTRHIYELLGKGPLLHLSMDIGAVVEGRYDRNYASGY